MQVPTQSRLSILAACEDPGTVSQFQYSGDVWPLPQTGQMWLEHELLNDRSVPGYFCESTSYRQEPDPVPGRHDLIFPMFEFEFEGDLDDLIKLERRLFDFLGFGRGDAFPEANYLDVARRYNTGELEHCHEAKMEEDYGKVAFLKNFPNYTSPFWNMAQNKVPEVVYNADGINIVGAVGTARKVDTIVHGMETVGAAERSSDPDEMRRQFHTISGGHYAKLLYGQFGKDRVNKELDEFLNHKFFTRCGGGIGVTRLIRAMKLSGLL